MEPHDGSLIASLESCIICASIRTNFYKYVVERMQFVLHVIPVYALVEPTESLKYQHTLTVLFLRSIPTESKIVYVSNCVIIKICEYYHPVSCKLHLKPKN